MSPAETASEEVPFAPFAPALRRRHGLYATPPEIVGYLVRSVHDLLKRRFGKPAGLADPSVRLLDPAAGPMTFVLAACREALAEHRRRQGERGIAELVREHLVPHFVGFELLPGPYALGQLAMARLLEAEGVRLGRGERARLYLADTLADPTRETAGLPPFLAREAAEAARVKTTERFSVVLGNPPFRGHSEHRGEWINGLLHGYRLEDGREDEGYYRVDGQPLGERNLKWLQDDWVKFLRLAQWKVDQNGSGIVALVVNNNGLDAPTFRGVRASLLRSFEEIYVLDLHGNARKRERAPDGGRDENVFPGVAQGIALLLLVKRGAEAAP